MRIKFLGAMNGERYGYAGVGTKENDWTLPSSSFQMEELIGKHLLVLETTEGEELHPVKEADGGYKMSMPISGFLTWTRSIRCYGSLEAVASAEGLALVMFGADRLQEEWTDVPNADLADVATPITPRSNESDESGIECWHDFWTGDIEASFSDIASLSPRSCEGDECA